MPKIDKPSGLSKLWASAGAKTAPDDTKVALGWVVETPPHQTENWLQNRNDTAVAHINQAGIPEWSPDVEYIGNFSWTLGSNGFLYACKITNTNNNPVTDVVETYWKQILDRNSLLQTLQTTTYTRGLLLTANESALYNYLNVTSLGKTIVQSPSQSSIRTAIGATTVGSNVFTSATQLDARIHLGIASADDTTEGLVARATDGESITGVNDTKFLTPKKLKLGFSISLTGNGHIRFPSWLGSFTINWGSVTLGSNSSTTVVSFPSAALNAQVSIASTSTDGSQAMNVAVSGASVIVTNPESSARAIYWFAIGY